MGRGRVGSLLAVLGRALRGGAGPRRRGAGRSLLLLVAVGAAACAPAPRQEMITAAQPASSATRTINMIVNTEVTNLASKVVGPVNPARTTRLFNAGLTLIDGKGEMRPYLAAGLPQLNTESWRVLPSGGMETVWSLRPNLSWHDGTPLTADDFVFAFGLYKAPGLAVFEPKPQNLVDQVIAVDPQTIRVLWNSPYLDTGQGLDPLPKAVLADEFAEFERDPAAQRDTFMSLRFWTSEYVGAGPFRLAGWEPASHMEGAAFDGHALGRPRIDRFVLRFSNDGNTNLATILAGQTHLIMRDVIGFENAMVLRRQGGFNETEGKGKLLFIGTATITAAVQHRVEHQQTPALLDVRVRRALAHVVDREAINDGLYEGQAPIAWTFVLPEASYAAEVDRAITKYPYDPRRAEQLMNEAGYMKGRDGFFASAAGGRFQPNFWNPAGAQREQLLAILLHTWQHAGVDVQPYTMPNTLARDQVANATFPGMLDYGISLSESGSGQSLSSEQIGSPANRWSGSNRGGYSHPEYDLLWERYNRTLHRTEQIQAFVEMMKHQSEQVPNFPLYYLLSPTAHVSAVRGPEAGSSGTIPHWNIHEWELAG
jgi:peptide/nickel transport system substrate-binding protein